MATNTSWGFGEWNAYNWGGLGQDVTVLVGAEDGWGRSTWGSGYYGTIVPDVTLQLTEDHAGGPRIKRRAWPTA